MRVSVFSSVKQYIFGITSVLVSLFEAMKTTLPYFAGVGQRRKEVTEQYPDPVSSRSEEDLPTRTRGVLYNNIEKCTGCGHCVPVCPTGCIRLEHEPGASHDKRWVSTYDIDLGRCVFCGVCVESCEPGSLSHTRKFEAASFRSEGLIHHFGKGEITPEQKRKWEKMREYEEDDF